MELIASVSSEELVLSMQQVSIHYYEKSVSAKDYWKKSNIEEDETVDAHNVLESI